jgi:hypothetical protein
MKIILIFLFCFSIRSNGQSIYLKYPVLLDVNQQYIEVFNKKDSSVVTNLPVDSSKAIRVYNFNKLGRLDFIILDNSHRIMMKGHYIESIALLSDYVYVRKLNGKLALQVRKFYQPIRNGFWYYFDESGKVYLKEKYIEGILTSCESKNLDSIYLPEASATCQISLRLVVRQII